MINTVTNNKKGISLIVLVITIIVMIIIAGGVVLTLSSTGIIDKAMIARKASDLADVKAIVDVAWADAYAGGARKSTEIKAIMEKKLEGEDLSNYNVRVTPYGATVTEVSGNEKRKGFYSIEGELNEYGFYFNYPYSINVGALSADSSLPVSKLGFVLREDGSVDLVLSLANMGNIPIRFEITEFLKLIGEEIDFSCRYEPGAVIIRVTADDGSGNMVTEEIGRLEFTEDGNGVLIEEAAEALGVPLALNCDFTEQREAYRDTLYSGVVKDENGEMYTIKAEYGSDGIFSYYDSKSNVTRSIEAEVIFGCILATDVTYTEDGNFSNGKIIAIVSADGEYLFVEPSGNVFEDMMQGIVRVQK